MEGVNPDDRRLFPEVEQDGEQQKNSQFDLVDRLPFALQTNAGPAEKIGGRFGADQGVHRMSGKDPFLAGRGERDLCFPISLTVDSGSGQIRPSLTSFSNAARLRSFGRVSAALRCESVTRFPFFASATAPSTALSPPPTTRRSLSWYAPGSIKRVKTVGRFSPGTPRVRALPVLPMARATRSAR